MRSALIALTLLFAAPLWADGLDEAYIASDPSSGMERLLQRAGFTQIQRSYALVIGVHEFDDFDPLPTEQDPQDMRDYLVHEAGFDHVHILTGDKVTKRRVEELMLDVFGETVTENDRFLLYWSGHGHTIGTAEDARGFLPVKTSDKTKRSSMISMENIRFWDSFIEARQVLYLMDACYSGLVGAVPQSDLSQITRDQLSGPSRHVLTAGNRDEQTIAIDPLGGSIFTHALLKGLRGEADSANIRGKDGLVSLGELRKYLGEEITELREFYGWERSITPQMRDLRGSDGAFFFPVPAAFPDTASPDPVSLSEVEAVQNALRNLGLDPGPVTGEMSFQTKAALIVFQRQQGLIETGKIDDATREALPFALAGLIQPQGQQETLDQPVPEPELDGAQTQQTPPATTSCELCPEMIPVSLSNEDRTSASAFVSKDFYIAKTEVTVGQYVHYLEDIGVADPFAPRNCSAWQPNGRLRVSPHVIFSQPDPELLVYEPHRDQPAACVSWEDAQGYIDWLNRKNPETPFRLPTEAEYTFLLRNQFDAIEDVTDEEALACSIGNFGDNASQFRWRNTACEDGNPEVAFVAQYPASPQGVFDLAGNLWEWAAECWRADPSETPSRQGCTTGTVRGGSFDDPLKNVDPGIRQPVPADRRQTNIGFRVARDAQ